MASLHSLMLQGQRGARLSGTLPASSWPLDALYLGHNRLSGSLPSTISTPIVDLDANAFTGTLTLTLTQPNPNPNPNPNSSPNPNPNSSPNPNPNPHPNLNSSPNPNPNPPRGQTLIFPEP